MATSRLRAKTDNQALAINILLGVVGCFTLLLVVLIVCMANMASEQRLFVPPDIREGAIVSTNDVPPVYAYDFAFRILQKLYGWNKDGDVDFPSNLEKYGFYLTQSCRQYFSTENELLKFHGELKNRQRVIREDNERPFKPDYVTPVSRDAWDVDLGIRLEESINGTIVKDNSIVYPIRVVRYSVDPDKNPWGFALDCFSTPPQLVTNHLLARVEK